MNIISRTTSTLSDEPPLRAPTVRDMSCYLHLAWNSTRAVGGAAGEAARGAGGRGRKNGTKNKPNNPNFEGCGKLWQSLGMWAVICIWRTIPGGLMSVETESCEYSTLSFAFGMDPSCYDRPPSLGDPAVGVRMDIVCLVLCCMLL